MSGGEKQRTAICRAMAENPELILADEPTGNLDSNSSKQVIHTLSYINQEFGKTIVMVTHDPQMASYCSRLILLKDGVILEDLKNSGNQEVFYQEILGKMKRVVEVSQKISISKIHIENKNQACYSTNTQMQSNICNVSIFTNSFTSSPDIRA